MNDDDDVMFQGKWIDVDNGSFFIPDDLAKQIQDSPPKPGTLYGKTIVIADNRESDNLTKISDTRLRPGNCHNGPMTVATSLAKMMPVTNQCQATRAAIETQGLTRRGACPTIRNPRKGK
jgi:hypothetical protein